MPIYKVQPLVTQLRSRLSRGEWPPGSSMLDERSAAYLEAIRAAQEQATVHTTVSSFEHRDGEIHRLTHVATRNELLIGLHNILATLRQREAWTQGQTKADYRGPTPRLLPSARENRAVSF